MVSPTTVLYFRVISESIAAYKLIVDSQQEALSRVNIQDGTKNIFSYWIFKNHFFFKFCFEKIDYEIIIFSFFMVYRNLSLDLRSTALLLYHSLKHFLYCFFLNAAFVVFSQNVAFLFFVNQELWMSKNCKIYYFILE
jgi:hypothetical protein